MPAGQSEMEKKLWASANSHHKSSEYSVPVLGLIFPFTFFGSAGLGQQSFTTARSGLSRRVPGHRCRDLSKSCGRLIAPDPGSRKSVPL
jgi:hypothetical protein